METAPTSEQLSPSIPRGKTSILRNLHHKQNSYYFRLDCGLNFRLSQRLTEPGLGVLKCCRNCGNPLVPVDIPKNKTTSRCQQCGMSDAHHPVLLSLTVDSLSKLLWEFVNPVEAHLMAHELISFIEQHFVGHPLEVSSPTNSLVSISAVELKTLGRGKLKKLSNILHQQLLMAA